MNQNSSPRILDLLLAACSLATLVGFVLFCCFALLTGTGCSPDHGLVTVDEQITVVEEVVDQTIGDYGYTTGTIHDQAVDILFIVDQSGSMSDDQARLMTYMPSIYDILTGATFIDLDWRVGVMSMSGSSPAVVIDWDDEDAYLDLTGSLAALSSSTYTTYGDEDGLADALNALLYWDNNDIDFFRNEADALIIFISDEPDQSGLDPAYYSSLVAQVKDHPFIVTESAVTLLGEGATRKDSSGLVTCFDSPNSYYVGDGYIDVSEVLISLCDDDWENVLTTVKDHVPTLNEKWPLDSVPYYNIQLDITFSDSIDVYFNGVRSVDWFYDPGVNSVFLSPVPPVGTDVDIIYLTSSSTVVSP